MIAVYLVSSLLTVFSAAMLLYVSLATGFGPWIGPMLVLCIRAGSGLLGRARLDARTVARMTIFASFGGAIATGIGFSLPTLQFVDGGVWDHWMQHPVWFCFFVGSMVIAAGLFGIGIARRIAPLLAEAEHATFPVSSTINRAIEMEHKTKDFAYFGAGVVLPGVVAALRGCALYAVQLSPVCWAVGFLAGAGVIAPLFVGLVIQNVGLYFFHACTRDVVWGGLSLLERNDITFAFCSGLLVSSLVRPFLVAPLKMLSAIRDKVIVGVRALYTAEQEAVHSVWQRLEVIGGLLIAGLCCYLRMPIGALFFLAAVFVPVLEHMGQFTVVTGLATYGRYMTIVMIPLLFMPAVSATHVVVACTLVGIAGGALADGLFSYRVGQHFGMQEKTLHRMQVYGLLVTALSVGILFWGLSTHFTLGTAPLVAQRAVSRALLMKAFRFNVLVLVGGFVVGLLLEWVAISPVMVFGGLIMPAGLVLSLIVGALLRHYTRVLEQWTFFWSGVLAGDIVWLVVALAIEAVYSCF